MIIRLIKDLPVEPVHQMNEGNVYKTNEQSTRHEVWVNSHKTGEPVKLWASEYEILNNKISDESMAFIKDILDSEVSNILDSFGSIDDSEYCTKNLFKAYREIIGEFHKFDPEGKT